MVTPLMRRTLPAPSTLAAAVPMHQRISPFGAQHAELGLLRACTPRHALRDFFQRVPIVGMNESANVVGGDFELARLDAKDAVLPLVPAPFAGADVPVPRAHLTGGERQAAALLALDQPSIGGFELGGALGDAPLELRIELLELRGSCDTARRRPSPWRAAPPAPPAPARSRPRPSRSRAADRRRSDGWPR